MNSSVEQLLERRYALLGENAPLFYDRPLHIVRGEGVWLYDSEGKRYLDCYNNVPCVGHCHPHVVDAIYRQARTLNVHTRYLHDTIIEYGERLTAGFDDSLSMTFFVCTGSEANEIALRMARHLSGGMGIICTDDTYHGNTAAVGELATLFRGGKATSPNVRAIPVPEQYRPLHDLEGEALADAYIEQIEQAIDGFNTEGVGFAGMLVCPIFANEGLPDVPPGFLARAAELVRDAGGYLIFDEVQSGFGRTGNMWGQETVGVVPDIVTLGKPMGNGHPLAGVIARPDMVRQFTRDHLYFNTFGGNPVSCAAGMAVLDVIENEGLIENVREVGGYLESGLRALADKHDVIGDVRVRGLFVAVELVTDRVAKTPAGEQSNRCVNLMKDGGVLISRVGRGGNVLKMRPPIVFDRENADQALAALDDALAAL